MLQELQDLICNFDLLRIFWSHKQTQEISNEYWCFPGLNPDGSGEMKKESYMQLNRKLHLALVGTMACRVYTLVLCAGAPTTCVVQSWRYHFGSGYTFQSRNPNFVLHLQAVTTSKGAVIQL